MSKERFKGLSNEEITYIYFYLSNKLSDYDDIINDNGVSHVIDGPIGKVGFFQEYSQEKIDLIKNSNKIKYMRNIIKKLKPIVELIEDSETLLVQIVKNSVDTILLTRFNDNDNEDNEDML